MDYNLLHKKRKLIFEQFLYHSKLGFSELEKLTKLRSNDLAYFLDKLEKEGILQKNAGKYSLSEQAELYIPFFVDKSEKLSPLTVILTSCITYDEFRNPFVLLIKRDKRPFHNHWGLPGGRINLDETFKDASERIMKEKTFLDTKFKQVNTFMHEKVRNNSKTVHAYIIFLVQMSPASEICEKTWAKWFPVNNLPKDIIPSDKYLLKNHLHEKCDLKEEIIDSTQNNAGDEELSMRFIE